MVTAAATDNCLDKQNTCFEIRRRGQGEKRITNLSKHSIPKDDDYYELREEYDLAQLPILPKGRYAPERLTDAPVEQFIGAIKSPATDWADQHDTYIGKMIMAMKKTY